MSDSQPPEPPQPQFTTAPAPPDDTKPDGRKWWKKKRFIIPIAAFVLIGVVGSLGDSDSKKTEDVSSSSPTTAKETTSQEKTTTTPKPTTTTTTEASPAPIAMSGSGQKATDAFPVKGGLTVFRMTHRGSANFIVYLLDDKGTELENLTNEIGRYDGSIAKDLEAGRYILKIQADGTWTANVEQPRPSSGTPLPASVDLTGQQVAGPYEGNGEGVRFALKHSGQANFIAYVLDKDGREVKNLVNEIGLYDGSTIAKVPKGLFYLQVRADGAWHGDMSKV